MQAVEEQGGRQAGREEGRLGLSKGMGEVAFPHYLLVAFFGIALRFIPILTCHY